MTATATTFELAGDIYKIARRPNHAELIVNDDYAGIRVVDPWTGASRARVAFPPEYARSGAIAGWCLRGDGNELVVFDDDTQSGCWISLVEGTSAAIGHTPWADTAAMPYDWRGDTLWLKEAGELRFASMTMRRELVERDGYEALTEARAWRRATDRLRRMEATCARVESDHGRMLVAGNDQPSAGIVGWVDQPEIVALAGEPFARLAAHGDRLVTMASDKAHLLDEMGEIARTFAVPGGFRFVDLDTLPASEGRPAAVVLVSHALDRAVTHFDVYAL